LLRETGCDAAKDSSDVGAAQERARAEKEQLARDDATAARDGAARGGDVAAETRANNAAEHAEDEAGKRREKAQDLEQAAAVPNSEVQRERYLELEHKEGAAEAGDVILDSSEGFTPYEHYRTWDNPAEQGDR
jgi:hypothetical protein